MSDRLSEIALALVTPGKGILAADESTGTIKKRFDTINTKSTEDARRDFRHMLFSTPAMKVEATAPRPTSRTPSRPSAGSITGKFAETKSWGSRAMPRARANSNRGRCHWAGMRPVLAQCCTVLCRLPSRLDRADWPPKRWMICSAGFFCVSITWRLPIFSLLVNQTGSLI